METDMGPRFLFCFFKDGEITSCSYAHRNDPVERGNVDDDRKKGKMAGVLSLNSREGVKVTAQMEGTALGDCMGHPEYQEKAECMGRDTEVGGGEVIR